MASFFNKEKLSQLAAKAKQSASQLGSQAQSQMQQMQHQMSQRRTSSREGGWPNRTPACAAAQPWGAPHPPLPLARCAGEAAAGLAAGPSALPPPPPDRTSSGGLSSLSPDEAIHLLQSQVGAAPRLAALARIGVPRFNAQPLPSSCSPPLLPPPAEQGAAGAAARLAGGGRGECSP